MPQNISICTSTARWVAFPVWISRILGATTITLHLLDQEKIDYRAPLFGSINRYRLSFSASSWVVLSAILDVQLLFVERQVHHYGDDLPRYGMRATIFGF